MALSTYARATDLERAAVGMAGDVEVDDETKHMFMMLLANRVLSE
jgi:hypothetical protein